MWGYTGIGLAAGVLSGILGIGGGILIIPAVVFFYGLSQQQAQGITLAALIPPVGLLAAINYWRAGNLPLKPAAFVAIGLFVGAYFGSLLAQQVSSRSLKFTFGIFLLLVGGKMIADAWRG